MELRSVGLKAVDETCWITLLRRMNAISNDCSLNTSATTTKTARILDWGREHPTAGFVPWLQVALFLATDSVGCIIVTIRLPDPDYFSSIIPSITRPCVCAFPRRSTLSLLRAILDQVHAVVRKNRTIFGADRILAKDKGQYASGSGQSSTASKSTPKEDSRFSDSGEYTSS